METKKQKDEAQQSNHILLRVRSEDGQTISGHTRVIAERGAAMLGKMGQPVSSDFRNILNQQIKQGVKTYLFLLIREGWGTSKYEIYRCSLNKVHETLDETKKSLIPRYYAFESNKVTTWFEITSIEPLRRDEIERIFVLSSGRPITSAYNSQTPIFRVGIQEK